jgi:hypothetical protein
MGRPYAGEYAHPQRAWRRGRGWRCACHRHGVPNERSRQSRKSCPAVLGGVRARAMGNWCGRHCTWNATPHRGASGRGCAHELVLVEGVERMTIVDTGFPARGARSCSPCGRSSGGRPRSMPWCCPTPTSTTWVSPRAPADAQGPLRQGPLRGRSGCSTSALSRRSDPALRGRMSAGPRCRPQRCFRTAGRRSRRAPPRPEHSEHPTSCACGAVRHDGVVGHPRRWRL